MESKVFWTSKMHFSNLFFNILFHFFLKSQIWDHYESKRLELEGLEVPDGKKECRNVFSVKS